MVARIRTCPSFYSDFKTICFRHFCAPKIEGIYRS